MVALKVETKAVMMVEKLVEWLECLRVDWMAVRMDKTMVARLE